MLRQGLGLGANGLGRREDPRDADTFGSTDAGDAEQHSRSRIWRSAVRMQKRKSRLPSFHKGRYEGAVIDAPWSYHAPKLFIWCGALGVLHAQQALPHIISQGLAHTGFTPFESAVDGCRGGMEILLIILVFYYAQGREPLTARPLLTVHPVHLCPCKRRGAFEEQRHVCACHSRRPRGISRGAGECSRRPRLPQAALQMLHRRRYASAVHPAHVLGLPLLPELLLVFGVGASPILAPPRKPDHSASS